MPRKKFLSITILLSAITLSACGLFKPKVVESFEIRIDEGQNIMYGEDVEIDLVITYTNGKTKNVTNWDEVIVNARGGSYDNGKVSLPSNPSQFIDDEFTIEASYTDEEISLKAKKTVSYNYRDYLRIEFNGHQGPDGLDGSNGGTALLFRDGKAGDTGGQGGMGLPGDDLSIFIWKDQNLGKLKIKVENLSQGTTSYFTYIINDKGLNINVNGGRGGNGGDGGNGGEGKDGRTKNDKKKEPGDGGNGGDGGIGGTGGTGGVITIFLHENAKAFRPYIFINNLGGQGGEGGEGGIGGKGGLPLTGQEPGTDGLAGNPGSNGLNGSPGPEPTILIQEFDTE